MLLNAWPPPQLEIELKYLLDADGHRLLLEKKAGQILGQETFTTFYLDTKKGHLKQSGFNLRVRLAKEFAKLTLKFATVLSWDGESKPKMRWELEDSIPVDLAREVVEGRMALSRLENRCALVLKANIAESKLDNLKTAGQLDIQRTKVQWAPGVVLEVDRYQVSGEQIYEIEIEVAAKDPDTVHRDFVTHLDSWKIDWQETEVSKRSRLFESLARRNR